jgi:hypothetical protein
MSSPEKSKRIPSDIRFLLQLLDEGFKTKTWHGPNLRQSIRGVLVREAAWRPQRGRHNIWELTTHAAYWKYVVRRRLLGEKRGSFSIKGSNFFAMPRSPSSAQWQQCRELLDREHRKLVAVVSDPKNAAVVRKRSRAILGVAFHDVYHAGQIRLLRRLQQ